MHRRRSKFATEGVFPPQRRANLRCSWARAASLAMIIRVTPDPTESLPTHPGRWRVRINAVREGGQVRRICSP
jgi:hypothetical protein